MSNSLAIAATTLTLQAILATGSGASVTMLPPDKARGSNTGDQLNLFLYQILPNAAWRNMNIPGQGEAGNTPLALTLHYMLTAFGADNQTASASEHQLLGRAMSVLYDHALLGADEIKSAAISGSDLHQQVERVRITLQPLTLEEISKLWSGLASQYRLSVAYEVSVALIESTRPRRAPLPVLTRGPGDQGISSQADLVSPFPALEQIQFPNNQSSALLGDTLVLTGHHLDGSKIEAIFNHPLLSAPLKIGLVGGTASQLSVQLPNLPPAPADWPAGFYTVAVILLRPGDILRRTTNLLSFGLAPSMIITPTAAAGPNITYTATCTPEVRPEQRVALLLGDQEIMANAHATQTGTLDFDAKNIAAGDYFVRLRVDGVDSRLVDRSVSPPRFDPTQKVTVT